MIYSNGMPNSVSQYHAEPLKQREMVALPCGFTVYVPRRSKTLGGLLEMYPRPGSSVWTQARARDHVCLHVGHTCALGKPTPSAGCFFPAPWLWPLQDPLMVLLALGTLKDRPVLRTILGGLREKVQGLCRIQETSASSSSPYMLKLLLSFVYHAPNLPHHYMSTVHILILPF